MTRLAVPLLALVALLSGCNVSQTAPKSDYPYSSTQYLSWYPGDTAGQQNAAAIEKVRSAAPNGTLVQGIRTAYAKLGNGAGEAWALGIYKEYRLVMYELESLHLSALSQGAITSPEQVQALVSIAGSPTKVGLPDYATIAEIEAYVPPNVSVATQSGQISAAKTSVTSSVATTKQRALSAAALADSLPNGAVVAAGFRSLAANLDGFVAP